VGDRRAAYEVGLAAEEAVARFLEKDGWTVLERRWRAAGAEVDLIVKRAQDVRFVEVKFRAADDPVGLESIDARKIGRLERAAEAWLARNDDGISQACLAVAFVGRSDKGWEIEFLDDPT
jgi:putative endonuclease